MNVFFKLCTFFTWGLTGLLLKPELISIPDSSSNNILPYPLEVLTPVKEYPKGYFRAPMDIPLLLSGSFGELRPNHFHSGLDIKTQQREGIPVYASADGFVSRLRVQLGGGGHAVYINHPNGYSTVYMHLQRFAPRLATEVKNTQYAKKSFPVDFQVLPGLLPVKKGELIGYSGNTGGSGGPHLHWEIRDSKTERPVNPKLMLPIKDSRPPIISGLYIYPMDLNSSINGKNDRSNIPISALKGSSSYSTNTPITLNGKIGFGIICNDKQDGSENLNGVYSIELKEDGVTVFSAVFDQLDYSLGRNINSYIDYGMYQANKRYIQKSFIDPGNVLPIYKIAGNRGILIFEKKGVRKMEYIVKDISGNTSKLSFNVTGTDVKKNFPSKATPGSKHIAWNEPGRFDKDDVCLEFQTGSLYDDLDLDYRAETAPPGAYSKLHRIHNTSIPINKSYSLKIKPDPSLAQTDKACIVNEKRGYQGGRFEDGYVKASLTSFGAFYVTVDTIPPKITPLNIAEGKNMSAASAIQFKVSDDLSGINEWNGYLDGQWVLFDFEPKKPLLQYTFDKPLTPGKHHLKLVVKDNKSNTNTYEVDFIR